MSTKNKRIGGVSADAILLMFIKLVTAALGLVITRLLSEYLSLHDYGTYSQILLIVSALSSGTIFGMMDGVNYFYCSERDPDKRESYVATIFALQCTISAVAGGITMLCAAPICAYFANPDIKPLMIFAVILPLLQNLLGLFQILLVSEGKARLLAGRNFLVSAIRLIVVYVVTMTVRDVAVVLATTLVLDIAQIAIFWIILRRTGCSIRVTRINISLVAEILKYCAPMAIYIVVNALNRDMDKYFVSAVTDTETLALYTNASKQLPFDIIMSSFCTVLIPGLTRCIAENKTREAASLYSGFLEIAYISTGILCGAALASAPQLMKLLYSEKYMSGLSIFRIYILVDLLRFTNITLVLSAAGRTKRLMIVGLGAIVVNAVLNFVLYRILGLVGPAVATLIVTCVLGILMLHFSARILDTRLSRLFDRGYLLRFGVKSVGSVLLLWLIGKYFQDYGMPNFLSLIVIVGLHSFVMLLFVGKRLLDDMKKLNYIAKKD